MTDIFFSDIFSVHKMSVKFELFIGRLKIVVHINQKDGSTSLCATISVHYIHYSQCTQKVLKQKRSY